MPTFKNLTLSFSPLIPNPHARSRQEVFWGEEAKAALASQESLANQLYSGWLKRSVGMEDMRCEMALIWGDGLILAHTCVRNSMHEQNLSSVLIYAAAFQCASEGLDKMPVTSDATTPYIEVANRLAYSSMVNVLLEAWDCNSDDGDVEGDNRHG